MVFICELFICRGGDRLGVVEFLGSCGFFNELTRFCMLYFLSVFFYERINKVLKGIWVLGVGFLVYIYDLVVCCRGSYLFVFWFSW